MKHATIDVYPIPILKDNYVWTLIDRQTRNTVVVDPGDAAPVIAYLEEHQLTLVGILITHKHWDHTNGVQALMARYHVPAYASAVESLPTITHPIQGDHATITIPNFPLSFKVLAIPGHTSGHVAYYADGMVFTGDTLFACGCGRIFEGTPAQMYQSLQTLAALPADTKVYCGHEYTQSNLRFADVVEPSNQAIKKRMEEVKNLRAEGRPTLPSSIAEELQTNPFLRCNSSAVRTQAEEQTGKKLPFAVDVFTALRHWKNDFV